MTAVPTLDAHPFVTILAADPALPLLDLTALGAAVARDGLAAHESDVLAVADRVAHLLPGTAAALADTSLREPLRLRALAVASLVLSRSPAAAR